jgi:hypothetical protein
MRPLLSGRSPAINASNPADVPASDETDLLGHPRLQGAAMDIGAVEVK